MSPSRTSLRRVVAVAGREFLDLRRNPRLWISVYLVPMLVAVVAIPALSRLLGTMAPGQAHLARQAPAATRSAAFYIVGQFMSYLFMFALFQPLALGAQAIVAEKQEGTLEPLLASPLETWELLAGKALFVVVPATLLVWVMYGLELWEATGVLPAQVVVAAFVSRSWVLAIFVMAPLLALFVTLLLVTISARVSDPRTAQQLGALLILPMMAAGMSAVSGILAFDSLVRAAIALLAVACVALLAIAVRAFQREAILTRWT